VKFWVAVPTEFFAVIVMVTIPVLAGVPEIVAVPLPLLTKVTPPGRAPVSDSVGAGAPLVVTVNVNLCPCLTKVVAELVILGAVCLTVSVKDCVTEPVALVAAIENVDTPGTVGVPEMVAVPLPLLRKEIPLGKAPVSPSVGAG